MAEVEVTPPQFSVMTMLAAYPGHSNADLARLALLTPQTVTVIVANLERTGAVSRHAHAVHGRIQHLELTESGHALLRKCRALVHDLEDSLTRGLAENETQTIRRWLARVATGTVE
ncbi:MarR family transcriptional regulator [Bradyrhizobium liaoningense]|uniref:MarR family winged helix-turn-helix transcriptional regulator n=1 Tax=Bradyrhizobium liaoningense TaxID=43992 RepID=UPI002898E86B|nr:MarR family transcriptional regulator [Bradyrhizobium liaoningense]